MAGVDKSIYTWEVGNGRGKNKRKRGREYYGVGNPSVMFGRYSLNPVVVDRQDSAVG